MTTNAQAAKVDLWPTLLNEQRRKDVERTADIRTAVEFRTPIERDHDRILFSTPVRRLADKTQVFPLDKNDSVRDRLTHSIEVSNLSRSFGTVLAFNERVSEGCKDLERNLPALCAAIGLVHDIGNPPFGHQGESAIQAWFAKNEKLMGPLSKAQQQDFLKFEGNAQGFRLVTRLQLLNDNYGLDLSFATLAAMMKYPVESSATDKKHVASKKHGFFQAEKKIAEDVLKAVGLSFGKRHPLAYVMEACDDIAYVVFDAEDSIKKGLASISDLHAWLKHHCKGDELAEKLVKISEQKHSEYRDGGNLSPSELNDVSMQRFRAAAIGDLMAAAVEAFVANQDSFVTGSQVKPLLELSKGEILRKALKDFSFKHGYTHKSVLKIELNGFNVISRLMDIFWSAIVDRADPHDAKSQRSSPFTRLACERISENYRRSFENPPPGVEELPMRYREFLLLTDMVSGMTDSFAVDLCAELCDLLGEFDLKEKLSK
ncbi:dGTP triphosphohydrolase [Xanthomonas hortorum]|uniref:dGTP triphosphohydrolase n=1 Tax=Xanthomonas hortorum TaxID=56454 RepID=UPI0032E8B5CA